jgi:hypothetical protein
MTFKKKLSGEEIEQLLKVEKEQLTLKYRNDLAELEKKYESLHIKSKTGHQAVKPKRIKLSADLLIKMYTEGKTITEIREVTGHSVHYIYTMIKKLIEEGKLEERKYIIQSEQ